jgi:hypothetical protein
VEQDMRTPALAFAAILLASLPASAESWSSPSYTTRIEPRPFYGATVTIEEGVRVFRPLPPHDRVIINPGNATPIHLGVGSAGTHRSYVGGSRR